MADVKEFAAWAATVKELYPREKLLATKTAVGLWYDMLSDLSMDQLKSALKMHAENSTYSPTVADIRRLAQTDAGPTWAEAWSEVMHSISKYGSYHIREALDSLSPIARKTAEAIGYKEICLSEKPEVIRGQFRSAYEAIAKREKEIQQYSPDIRALLEAKNHKLLQEAK